MVHDDQVGPFARMEFDGCEGITYAMPQSGIIKRGISLKTTWRGSNGENSVRAVPQALLVPLYNKIRIPYEVIDAKIISFDLIVELLRGRGFISLEQRLSWKIFLTEVQKFKTEILESTHLNCDSKKEALTRRMPRFIWRAVANIGNEPAIEILFDATGIKQANLVIMALGCNNSLFSEIENISKSNIFISQINNEPCREIFLLFNKV